MSDSETPQPSPASLLAGVLRVVAPGAEHPITPNGRFVVDFDADWPPFRDPTSLDSLARVVAMLDGAQRVAYDNYIWTMAGRGDDRAHPSDVMLAPAATHLAALVAATGAR